MDWIKRLLFRKKYLMEVLRPPDISLNVDPELHIAAYEGDVERVKKLLKKGADPNVQEEHGRMPLHVAVYKGHVDVVRLLLEHGADPNIQNKDGETPLHNAALQGHVDIVRLLLEHGANPTIKDKDGKTPLDLAREEGYHGIVPNIYGLDKATPFPQKVFDGGAKTPRYIP